MALPDNSFVFCALGGIGEIGMNMALYGFGTPKSRKWLMVDCGVSFGGPDVPGIDLIMPDTSFIEKERNNLVGIVITHAHEDHIGALVHLWPKLRVPVYLTPFAAALLEAKRLMEDGAPKIDMREVPQRGRITLGPFDVEFIDVAHSIPESNALAIRTALGTVIHTGDWKIDPTPVIPPLTDEARFMALGDEGVLALIGDSTNAVREGRSPSERDVSTSLADIIRTAKGRVAITTFASNVGRIRSVAEAALATGRTVMVVGRAMERALTVARERGLLDGIPSFLGPDNFDRIPRDKTVLVLTGSQGEQRAALARIARKDHPDVTLAPSDMVVFSSRTIPGNEKEVGGIINGLIEQGVEVVTDRTHLVHVSGHPRRDELKDMYRWTRPKIAIPVHGEALHLLEHMKVAKEAGVGEVIRVRDGDLVQLAPGAASVIGEVPVGRMGLDGEILINLHEDTVAQRRKLAFAGHVTLALAISDRGEILSDPDVKISGLPASLKSGEDMVDYIADKALEILEGIGKAKRRDPDAIEEAMERGVRSAVDREWGKKPNVHVIVLVA